MAVMYACYHTRLPAWSRPDSPYWGRTGGSSSRPRNRGRVRLTIKSVEGSRTLGISSTAPHNKSLQVSLRVLHQAFILSRCAPPRGHLNSDVIWLPKTPMAFSEQQLKQIDRQVGALCERRAPAHVRDK